MKMYEKLKDDGFWANALLEEEELLKRFAVVTAVLFLAAFSLTASIYPIIVEYDDGTDVVWSNLGAASAYGLGLVGIGLVALIGRLGEPWANVQRDLSLKEIYVEADEGQGSFDTYSLPKSKEELKRDRLLVSYEVGPAMERIRKYLLITLLATVAAWGIGFYIGGDVQPYEEVEEKLPANYGRTQMARQSLTGVKPRVSALEQYATRG